MGLGDPRLLPRRGNFSLPRALGGPRQRGDDDLAGRVPAWRQGLGSAGRSRSVSRVALRSPMDVKGKGRVHRREHAQGLCPRSGRRHPRSLAGQGGANGRGWRRHRGPLEPRDRIRLPGGRGARRTSGDQPGRSRGEWRPRRRRGRQLGAERVATGTGRSEGPEGKTDRARTDRGRRAGPPPA